jgi:pimeloyl-ACP methyl ester carboxylesterase
MLAAQSRLEVRSRLPRAPTRKPPLLFVHGGYTDGWCWEPNFLPWFAARGYASYALSLRGHGASGGAETLWLTGIDDYASDVERVASEIGGAPVLIGHSMGAAIVERIVAKRPVPGAVLIAPLPPAGLLPAATRLATEHPDYLMLMSRLDPMKLTGDVLHAIEPFYFSPNVPRDLLREAVRHLSAESPRALLDLSLRLHWLMPERNGRPLMVLGASGDRICTSDDVRATAAHYGVEATIVPGLAHMLMLEPGWEAVTEAIERWLKTLKGAR